MPPITFLPIRACLLILLSALATFSHPAQAIDTIARQAVLIEAKTGAVLFEKDAFTPMAPASMSKMMTIYLLFERLREGSLSLDDTFPVSKTAWLKGGPKSGSSTMFLEPGKRVRIEDLLRGIVVQSGNDACIVVAEGLAGDEASFAKDMTRRARDLGMNSTTFKNSTGWPDPEHLTTAYDLSILAQRTIDDFPDYFHFFSEKAFTYSGIRQTNRNPLLYKDMGVDGMKTGHTEASGYGLTATALRGGRRLILVINGLPNKKSRSTEPERLLEWGFREFKNYALFKASEEVVKADVWLGNSPRVPLVIEKDVEITISRRARRDLKVTVSYVNPIPAPIKKGAELAMLTINVPGQSIIEFPLVAGADVDTLGMVSRIGSMLKYVIFGTSG